MTLNEERKLVFKLIRDNDDLLGKETAEFISDLIRKQDKEFIKELKEEFHTGDYSWAKVIQIINKLAGADLI